MNAVASKDPAQRRKENFFKGTMRDPDAHRAPDAAIDQALIVVGASIDAQAMADGRELSNVQRERALSVAQRLLRALPRDQLQNISAHTGLIKSITDQSLAVAPVTDPRAAAQARLDERGQGISNGGAAGTLANRSEFDAKGRPNYAVLASSGASQLSEADTKRLSEIMPIARDLGMQWIPPRDLLAIGRDGIEAIAQTNLKVTGYKALREGSYYSAKDVVTFAKHAKTKGFDAEKAAHSTRDLIQAQPADQRESLAEVLKGYDRAEVEAHEKPNDPAAQQRLEESGQRQKAALQAIAKESPEQADRVRKFEEDKKVEERYRATDADRKLTAGATVEKADANAEKAEVKMAQADANEAAKIGDLDEQPAKSTASTSSTTTAKPGAPQSAGPKP